MGGRHFPLAARREYPETCPPGYSIAKQKQRESSIAKPRAKAKWQVALDKK
jgi:hypothetical protein